MQFRDLDLPADRPGIGALIDHTLSRGKSGLSENKAAFVLRDDGRPGKGVVAESGNGIVAYAGLAPTREPEVWAMEIVAGSAEIDVAALVEAVRLRGREVGANRLRWWVYDGDQAPDGLGFVLERALLMMGRPLPGVETPIPSGYRVAGFRPGVDEAALLAVNNAAFAEHRENGAMTHDDLERRVSMTWFDPAGVRMAWKGGDVAGFCWTKVHEDRTGEIYIIGIAPGHRGAGLGKALVTVGMRHLTEVGCRRVFLYSDGDNGPALALYSSLGFEIEKTHHVFIGDVD